MVTSSNCVTAGTLIGAHIPPSTLDAVMLKSAKYALGADCLCINHMDTIGEIGEN